MKLHRPLDYIKVTQPYGVNWLPKDNSFQYADFGLKGHNGIDFSCYYTPVYAVADGDCQKSIGAGYGVNIRLWVDLGNGNRMEVTYGHLKEVVKEGKVKRGDQIAVSDNTGLSTGPHLHLGIRMWGGQGITDYGNGYLGYIDPKPLFGEDMFKLPVELKYGETEMHMSLLQWYAANAYFWKVTGRLMTKIQKNAFIYGYWGMREVLDPVMYQTWTAMTKPAYLQKLGKL